MRLICIDVGSGTQDILLLDTGGVVENSIQLVIPSPTVLVAQQIAAATRRGEPVVLVGETMGGGACSGALKKHLEAGFKVYATEAAALTFSDDLAKVSSWGVNLISADEVGGIKNGTVIEMADVNLDSLSGALSRWGIVFPPDAVAVAVLDHGAAPAEMSQRKFRFQQLAELVSQDNTLDSFVFTANDFPATFSRMRAVARSINQSVNGDIPVFLMDTGIAAVLGVSLDEITRAHPYRLAVNLGNSHTIAFHLENRRILGLFEHHTSSLWLEKSEYLIVKLTNGDLKDGEIWDDGGHGSLILARGKDPFIVATGPRREMLMPSRLKPHFAAPFGSMMLTGCFGLALGTAIKQPAWREEIEKALRYRHH